VNRCLGAGDGVGETGRLRDFLKREMERREAERLNNIIHQRQLTGDSK
jgi:hypothetical protein